MHDMSRNPHALAAAMAASARHQPLTVATGDPEARWPIARWRIGPGLTALRAPRLPVYDINGGPNLSPEELAAQLALIGGQPHLPRVIVAKAMVAEGPVWDRLQELAREGRIALTPIITWQRALLDRQVAANEESYLVANISAAQRKRLRQKRRALELDGGLKLDVTEDAGGVSLGLDQFCALEAAGWKGRNGTALAQDATGHAYVCDVMDSMARENSAFTAVLWRGEQPVAAGLFLRAGGEAVFWKTTYDESLSKHSPGVIFDMMLTEWLYSQPWFERLDTGHDDSIDPDTLIWKQRRAMADVVIDLKPGSLNGRLVTTYLKARQRLRAWKNRRATAQPAK